MGSRRIAPPPYRTTLALALLAVLVASAPAAAQGLHPFAQGSAGPAAAVRQPAKDPKPAPPVKADADDGTLLVRFARGADPAAVARGRGAGLKGRVGRTDWHVVTVAAGSRSATRDALERDARVADVDLNRVRRISRIADDPWQLKAGQQAYLHTTRAFEAWDVSTGSSDVSIAVLDTGVDLGHLDLKSKLLPGRDLVGNDDRPDDDHGHGTSVAGVAAAATHNFRGISGMGWNTRVVPVKVLDRNGAGTDATIAAGITWAADQGVEIINLSLGGPGEAGVLRDAVAYAAARGVLVVAAAGNEGTDEPHYPASIPDVLSVGATTWAGDLVWWSSYGDAVDLVAPGVSLMATSRTDETMLPYRAVSGTSFSAPLVAGAASLLKAAEPSLSWSALAARLRGSARDAGPPGGDAWYGAGVLDAAALLGRPRRPPIAQVRGDAYEPNDSQEQARLVPLGGPRFFGTLAPEDDVDWYAVDVPQAGGWLGVSSDAPDDMVIDVPYADVAIDVFGPDLRPVTRSDATRNADYDSWEHAVGKVAAAGRHYVRVSGPNADGGHYALTIGTGGHPYQHDGRFLPAQTYAIANGGQASAIADVNRDGRKDVLVVGGWAHQEGGEDQTDQSLLVYLQDHDGGLRRQPPLLGRGAARDVTAGDLDGDGDTDALLLTSAGLEHFLQENGKLVRAPSWRRAGPVGIVTIQAVDVDGDGDVEVVSGRNDGSVEILTRGSTGWTARTVPGHRGWRPEEVEVADATGDGRRDIVVADGSSFVAVYARQADGAFSLPVLVDGRTSSTSCCDGVEVVDVTGDGRRDLAVTQGGNSDQSVTVLPALPTGGYGTPIVLGTHDIPQTIEAADLDADGDQDLVVTHGVWEDVGIYEQSGGKLLPERLYSVPYHNPTPNSTSLGDVNADGRVDLVLADDNHGMDVLRQAPATTPTEPPLWIAGSTPAPRSTGAATTVKPVIRLGRAADAASAGGWYVRLMDATYRSPLAATHAYDATTRSLTVTPSAPLVAGRAYTVTVSGLRDTSGRYLPHRHVLRFTVGAPPADTTPPDTIFHTGPRHRTSMAHPYLAAMATEPGSTLECRDEDQYPWRPCNWLAGSYSGSGVQTMRFRAVDAAGNVDPTPAARTFDVVASGACCPANDTHWHDVAITGESGSITASNVGATRYRSGEPALNENPGGSSIWWKWTAPTTRTVTFETTGSQIDTLLGAHTWAGEGHPIIPITSNDDTPGGRTDSRISFSAVAGRTYWISVDGFNEGDHYGQADQGPVRLTWNQTATASEPVPVTGTVSDRTQTAATLFGTISENGVPGTFRFQYGTSTAYGSSTPSQSTNTDRNPRQVSTRVTGLAPNTTYHFRLVITTASGRTLHGSDRTFTTYAPDPSVTTGAAEVWRPGHTRLTGTMVEHPPNSAGARFELGTTTTYGRDLEPSWDWQTSRWVANADGLRGATTYRYRMIAYAGSGAVVRGADRTFTTPPATVPAVDGVSTSVTGTALATSVKIEANGSPTTAWVEYGTTTAYGSRGAGKDLGLVSDAQYVDVPLTGLQPSTIYQGRIVAQNGAGIARSANFAFTTAGPGPAIALDPPAGLAATSVTLKGRVNPRGEHTWFDFQWLPKDRPAWQTWDDEQQPYQVAGSATSEVPVSQTLTGLVPTTTYEYRLIARSYGGRSVSTIGTFTTPGGKPAIDSSIASPTELGAYEATVTGRVSPQGPATSTWLEYGTTTAYGSKTPAVAIGDGLVSRYTRHRLTGLAQATTYHYRVVATNSAGTTYGEPRTLTTATAAPPP